MSSTSKSSKKSLSTIKIVIGLIVFWPLGLYFISKSNWKKNTKITVISVLCLLISLFYALMTIGIISSVRESDRITAALAAERARLESDPVTINGLYNALNKERTGTGAQALSTLSNLATSSQQICNDMVTNKYFDYKNPTTGKDSNDVIKDNAAGMYLPLLVASISRGDRTTQTATDIINQTVQGQAQNLNNPKFNSVGWAVCQSPDNLNEVYVVASLADKEEKPAAPQTIYKYVPSYVPSYTPTYTSPTRCYTSYHTYGGYFDPSADTTCY